MVQNAHGDYERRTWVNRASYIVHPPEVLHKKQSAAVVTTAAEHEATVGYEGGGSASNRGFSTPSSIQPLSRM